MQAPQTQLAVVRERFFLVGFVANETPLTLDTLPTWPTGRYGVAIIQRCIGAVPTWRIAVYRVQLQRIEIRSIKRGSSLVYCVVLWAPNPGVVYTSRPIPELERRLRQGIEVCMIWNQVPGHWRHCHHCGGAIRCNAAAYFESGLPVCSSYCTLLNKKF